MDYLPVFIFHFHETVQLLAPPDFCFSFLVLFIVYAITLFAFIKQKVWLDSHYLHCTKIEVFH